MNNHTDIILNTCNLISRGKLDKAKDLIKNQYPFIPIQNVGRKYTDLQKSKIFFRDGFIDRYSGDRLVLPGALRLLSKLIPEEFPFQKNWKTSECHIAYWQLLPTIDHVIPVSLGGIDDEANWVCTSQLRNSAKSNFSLEDLGWTLCSPGNLELWDGMNLPQFDGHSISRTMVPEGVSDEKKNIYT